MDEVSACTPEPLDGGGFNKSAILPCGLKVMHVRRAMEDFLDFLGFLNQQLHTRELPRLESFLMPANFSSIVGEFMGATITALFPSTRQSRILLVLGAESLSSPDQRTRDGVPRPHSQRLPLRRLQS